MLKRIKAQVTQVANELPDLLNNSGREASNGKNSAGEMPGECEGFLCPMCMTPFPSPDDLSLHFERAHTSDTMQPVTSLENPNFLTTDDVLINRRASTTSSTIGFSTKEEEIQELKHQLKDEKWFSAELKKELDRIQSIFAQSQDVPKEEVPYLMQQIQMLEAGKSMVTQRMLEFEKEGNQYKRQLEYTVQEKKEIWERLKTLTEKIRQLTEENEEKKTENAVMCEELLRVKGAMADLEKELDKPSEDDVTVLRKELVRAQQLMDEISLHKDGEMRQHLDQLRELSTEREKLKFVVNELQRQINDSGEQSSKKSEESFQFKAQLDSSMIELENHKQKAANLTTELEGTIQLLAEAEKRNISIAKELEESRKRVDELEIDLTASGKSADDFNESNKTSRKKIQELKEELKKFDEAKQQLQEQLSEKEENEKKLEQVNKNLVIDVTTLSGKLENEKRGNQEKNEQINNQHQKISELSDQVIDLQKELCKKDGIIDVKVAIIETQTREIGTLKENASDLLSKISEGEGGAKVAIDQLNEEKKRLLEDMKMIGDLQKEQKAELEEKIFTLEKESREKEKEKAQLEMQKTLMENDLKQKLSIAEEEIIRKAECFVEMERDRDDERKKTGEHFKQIKALCAEKELKIEENVQKNEELSKEIGILMDDLREKEKALNDSRSQVKQSLETLKAAEEKARKLEEELSQMESDRFSIQQNESEHVRQNEQLQKQLMENGEKNLKLANELIGLKEESERKQEAIAEMTTESTKNREQLKNALDKVQLLKDCSSSKDIEMELIRRNDELQKEFSMYKEKAAKLSEEIREKSDYLTSYEAEVEEIRKHSANKVALLEEQIEENLAMNDELTLVTKELTERNEKLQKEKSGIETKLSLELQTVEELMAKVDQNEQNLSTTRDELQKRTKSEASLKQQLESLQSIYEQLNGQLIQERNDYTKTLSTKQEEIITLQHQLDEVQENLLKQYDKAGEEATICHRKIESLQSEIGLKESQIVEVKGKLNDANSKNEELNKLINSWEDEKKALIERCLNTESDLDFERERATENKKRFDDALSAMHELGRANQSLQMDMSKQSSRKWLDDSEAVNCTACGKVFSLTVRKHHCRVCGLIFCSTCSSHAVKLASHKSPVRSCEPCFQESSTR
ncbi:unnamed protein product, partial [Mesorhabditis belari]|uniref:Early endosome antigen 1 n=1 Tax=Mesorhabditis belari TaxID=2138241 RepID=A0AAF3E8F2_9BILA